MHIRKYLVFYAQITDFELSLYFLKVSTLITLLFLHLKSWIRLSSHPVFNLYVRERYCVLMI